MTISVLTAKDADPVTGMKRSFMGFHFSGATIGDAFQGIDMMYASPAGAWKFSLDADPISSPPPGTGQPPIWRVQLKKDNVTGVAVVDPDWICFDGSFAFALTEAQVDADYDVTDWTPPA